MVGRRRGRGLRGIGDVCRELGLSATTLRRLRREGKGPPLLQLSERRSGVLPRSTKLCALRTCFVLVTSLDDMDGWFVLWVWQRGARHLVAFGQERHSKQRHGSLSR